MQIYPMTARHVAQIAQLETLCFSAPWSEQSIASELQNPLSLWLVAAEGECVVGYIGSQSVLGEADMMNVAVHPDHRRRGIARALIEALCAALAQADVHSLTLEVRASNAAAIALYETMGFATVGLRPNYYRHPREDARIMRKEWQG